MFEPNYEGSPIARGSATGNCSAKGAHVFAAQAGHHLAPQPLSSGRNIYDELRDGFTLLALDAPPAVRNGFAEAAAKLNVPLTIIADNRRDGRERYDASLVLIRPDQFVAWASNDGSPDAEAILRRTTGS